jgi:hypothetical protein
VAILNPTGPYEAAAEYSRYDLFTADGTLYLVLLAHTAPTTFNPDLTQSGSPVYAEVMPFPTAYDLGLFVPAQPGFGIASNEPIWEFSCTRPFTLVAGLTDSRATLRTATTTEIAMTLQKDGSSIGTVTFEAAQTVGIFTFASDVSFVAGNVLSLIRPVSIDATARNMSVTIVGRRDS